MPRFYSPEWVTAFNDGVAGLDAGAIEGDGSLTASKGQFRLAQIIEGVPDADEGPAGRLVAVLMVADGRLSLALADADEPADVTVALSWADASAMSRGDLDAAAALGAGRVRVRGDLSLLVTAQALLAAAADRLGDLQAATTY